MPRIVPGTYSISDFGRFVKDFKALDVQGNTLPTKSKDINAWKISDAQRLHRVTYTIDDTWDTEIKEDFIFEPGGTNIEVGKNFVINPFGFFGYFEGWKFAPFEISVLHAPELYGSTALSPTRITDTLDVFHLDSYMDLADAPMMYSVPDTTTLLVGGAEVLVSVYSPKGLVKSSLVAKDISDILMAQKDYLGGKLPIDRYAFIIYLQGNYLKGGGSGAHGALEHSYSSLYFLPEFQAQLLAPIIKDVAAHEFFHIITPLSIHSEEIGDFDFADPKMSEHLWLYEGVTEYFAGHVQAVSGLISEEEYLTLLEGKLAEAESYNDSLPFTVMSKEVLGQYKDEYGNVYVKGALIGLGLDILLNYLSDGEYNLQRLMADLAITYGKNHSFKDDELFDKVTALTYPQVGDYLRRHVAGSEPLPLQSLFAAVGIAYQPRVEVTTISLGGFEMGFNNDTERLTVADASTMDAFGKKLKYRTGDELVSINGRKLELTTVKEQMDDFFSEIVEGDKITVIVARPGKNGKFKSKKLKAKMQTVDTIKEHDLSFHEAPTEAQLNLRRAWLRRD